MEEKSVGLGAYAFELRFEAAPGPPRLRTERAARAPMGAIPVLDPVPGRGGRRRRRREYSSNEPDDGKRLAAFPSN